MREHSSTRSHNDTTRTHCTHAHTHKQTHMHIQARTRRHTDKHLHTHKPKHAHAWCRNRINCWLMFNSHLLVVQPSMRMSAGPTQAKRLSTASTGAPVVVPLVGRKKQHAVSDGSTCTAFTVPHVHASPLLSGLSIAFFEIDIYIVSCKVYDIECSLKFVHGDYSLMASM